MKKRSGAGALSELISFQRRDEIDDGFGNPVSGEFSEQFREYARLQPRMGGETVIASRMTGVQPFTMLVRSNDRTKGVTPAWRAVNARSGRVYNIITNVNVDERNGWQEMLISDGAV